MYEVEKSLFSYGQYNLGTSTSSLKKGEKNSLQKKTCPIIHVCMESGTCHSALKMEKLCKNMFFEFFLHFGG